MKDKIKAGERVRCSNGRTGSLIKRKDTTLKTSPLYDNYLTLIDDSDGLLDVIFHPDKNGIFDSVKVI